MALSVHKIVCAFFTLLILSGCVETDGKKSPTIEHPPELIALQGNLQYPDCYRVPAPIWIDLGFYRLFGPSIPPAKMDFDVWLEGTSRLLFIDAIHPCRNGQPTNAANVSHLDYGIISEFNAQYIDNDAIAEDPRLTGLNGRCMINIAYLSHEYEEAIGLLFVYGAMDDDTDGHFSLLRTGHPELDRLLFPGNAQHVTLQRKAANAASSLTVCEEQ